MRTPLFACAATLTVVLAAAPRSALAQAWVLPEKTGAVTLVAQTIDHVGRMTNDGTRAAVGKAINTGFDVELDYAFTKRLSATVGLPFILSKYTDRGPRPAFLPFPAVDACYCWQKAFADVGATVRYNVVDRNRAFVLTPSVSVVLPSHDYDYVGEAVVGRRLKELRFGVDAGQRLDRWREGLGVQAGYRYTVVGRVLGIPNNRSNGSTIAFLSFPRGFAIRGMAFWQRTHGGLRMPAEVNVPEFPERLTEFHRMLRDNYLHTGGGVSYSVGAWDLSGSVLVTARGSNSHDVRVFTVTFGRLFELGGH